MTSTLQGLWCNAQYIPWASQTYVPELQQHVLLPQSVCEHLPLAAPSAELGWPVFCTAEPVGKQGESGAWSNNT